MRPKDQAAQGEHDPPAHEVVHFFTHADKGIFYLVKMLATNPGKVAREYIRGKRKKYFSPLNFFLVVVGLFVFVQVSFKPTGAVNLNMMKEQVMKIPDPVARERRLAKLERMEAATISWRGIPTTVTWQ